MTGAEFLAWLIIGWFFVGTTWDVLNPKALEIKINSWPRAMAAIAVQISGIVAAAFVLSLSAVAVVLLITFFIIAVLLLIR
jgi:hypothetical protein